MRIIHTADWHIGQIFYGYDRTDEHAAAFEALVKIVAEKQPDALLISGDIFHNPQPSASSQAFLTGVITALRDAAPGMAIVITAGNHDSASRHEVFSEAWRRMGVYAVGSIADYTSPDFDKHIIETPVGYIIAVPYIYGRALEEGVFPKLIEEVDRRNNGRLPVVAMAHAMLSFAGDDSCGDFRGADEPKDIRLFGSGYDYLALGHVHHPAVLPGSDGRVRYSGSIIPINFAEDFEHGVICVDIESHGAAVVCEKIFLPTLYPVVSLPRTGFAPWSQVLEELKNFNPLAPCYVRLCVSREEPVPAEAAEMAIKICQEKGLYFCLLHYPPQSWGNSSGVESSMTFEEFREMSPADVATLYMRDCELAFDDDIKVLFDEVVDSLIDEEAQL